MDLLGTLSSWVFRFPVPLALAVVATLGYVLGRRNGAGANLLLPQSRRELRRARRVAKDLAQTASTIRSHLTRHQASLARFRHRLAELGSQEQESGWKDLCQEAEQMLAPTMELATQIAAAYDRIRQQSNHLMTFTEVRTDPLTGVGNRRGLDEALAAQFAMLNRYATQFSMVLFDIDHFKRVNDQHGHLQGDRLLRQLARLLDEYVRDTDQVSRYGGEEFVVVMPQTDLEGACGFAERLRRKVEEDLPITVSGGVTAALDGDTPDSLTARADAALYGAKSAGRNCLFRHTGEEIESILEEVPAAAGEV